MPLRQENIRLFLRLFVNCYKESSNEESEISPFPNLRLSYLKESLNYKFIRRIPEIQIFLNSSRISYK